MGERIRVVEWQPDHPYPRAAVEIWPDEPGEAVDVDAIRDIEDRMIACSSGSPPRAARRWSARHRCGRRRVGRPRDVVVRVGFPAPDGAGRPLRRARRAHAAARVRALSEAVDTVTAMVEFQLSE